MATLAQQRRQIMKLLDGQTSKVRVAFEKAISQINSEVVLNQLIDRIEAGDVEGAIAELNLDGGPFNIFLSALTDTFTFGGLATLSFIPKVKTPDGKRILFRFNVRNPTAEQYLRLHSSNLITNILEDQRQAIRLVLEDAMARGQNPRQTALDIVGRVVAGKRKGGIIGLTSEQAKWVIRYEKMLRDLDPRALNYQLRNKRYDGTFAKAMREGRKLTEKQIQRMAGDYKNKALKYRGETIARTETLKALNSGGYYAVLQQIEEGKVQRDQVLSTWHATEDSRTRFTHRVLDGHTEKFGHAFITAHGNRIRYPGDPTAPAEETVNCRCWMHHRIDFTVGVQ